MSPEIYLNARQVIELDRTCFFLCRVTSLNGIAYSHFKYQSLLNVVGVIPKSKVVSASKPSVPVVKVEIDFFIF